MKSIKIILDVICFFFFCFFVIKVNRNPFSFNSAFITLLSPNLPCRLLCHFCHNRVQYSRSLSPLVWRLAWWLLASSMSSGDASAEVSRNRGWCLVTFSILPQNYASLLTFRLMHKILNVCGTSCRRCCGEKQEICHSWGMNTQNIHAHIKRIHNKFTAYTH